MIRMTKQTDYGFVLLGRLAEEPERVANAPELAVETRLPAPMVSKVLKLLARSGVLASHRGVHGGYGLARPPAAITAAEVIQALEGPVALTVCIDGAPGECDREAFCSIRNHWRRINDAVSTALAGITVADLAAEQAAPLLQLGKGRTGRRPAAGRRARGGREGDRG
jgi:FeS assembly SUF system regulator